MDEQTENVLHDLETWCEAYPIRMFTDLDGNPMKKTGDYDTPEKCNLITRASAGMGRHMIKMALKPAIAEIRRLSGE